jgi:hypothetical protein
MTVQQLIDLLGECDPDATVRIMMQENWPFECELEGIAIREELTDDECDCGEPIDGPHEDDCPAAHPGRYDDGLAASDVFLVEGRQERYGDRNAWNVVRR